MSDEALYDYLSNADIQIKENLDMLVRCGACQPMEAELLLHMTDNEGNMNVLTTGKKDSTSNRRICPTYYYVKNRDT